MFPLDYILAAALLTAPPGTPTPPGIAALAPGVRLPIQALAVQWEILDPKEVRYLLARPDDLEGDLEILRRRFQELANAPAIDDSCRFPEPEFVDPLVEFNRAYRKHIGLRQSFEITHWWEIRIALQETDRLHQIWESVRDARNPNYYVTARRHALKRVRDLIGEEAYYAGNLPPCVPLWRFKAAD